MAEVEGARRQVRVSILNQPFTLVTDADPDEVEQLADQVDELIRSINSNGRSDLSRSAILASIHLADILKRTQDELNELKSSLGQRTRNLSRLLDEV
jgi:cell division protein ZapA (FtsZ GTPase activity inhibitor)